MQLQGYFIFGFYEWYKFKVCLKWEVEYDCNCKFKCWLLEEGIVSEQEFEDLE